MLGPEVVTGEAGIPLDEDGVGDGSAADRLGPVSCPASLYRPHPQERVYFPDPLSHWPARVGFLGFNPLERNTFCEPSASSSPGSIGFRGSEYNRELSPTK